MLLRLLSYRPVFRSKGSALSSLLEGIRVIDCTLAMAGPFAAQRLGDLRADVIMVEPITCEWCCHVAHPSATRKCVNPSVLSLNRNKRSMAIDPKSARAEKSCAVCQQRRISSERFGPV
ncbi:MAG: CoA transferase [Gemmatimonadaceae bacterium]